MKLKFIVLMFGSILLITGCNGTKLHKAETDSSGMHFTLKYTTGNWVNSANNTDTLTIPIDSHGIVDYKNATVINAQMITPLVFEGGFIEVIKGKSIEVRLLQKHIGFNNLMQYPGNGKYEYE